MLKLLIWSVVSLSKDSHIWKGRCRERFNMFQPTDLSLKSQAPKRMGVGSQLARSASLLVLKRPQAIWDWDCHRTVLCSIFFSISFGAQCATVEFILTITKSLFNFWVWIAGKISGTMKHQRVSGRPCHLTGGRVCPNLRKQLGSYGRALWFHSGNEKEVARRVARCDFQGPEAWPPS